MPQVLTYTVENAQIVTLHKQVDYDGNPATMSYQKAVVECVPTDHSGGVFSMALPPEALADFPEGATISVTVEVAPAAALTSEVGA